MREKSDHVKKSASAFVCLLAACLAQSTSAGPIIEGFSNSKTGDAKTMFLVKPGEKITFSVRVEGAPINEWTVNKKVTKNPAGMGLKSNSLFWTVPDAKGIWEIHVKARGKGGEVHQEWVVSTLSKEAAPDFFDYFTDGKWKDRTETDPWGRPLPEWKQRRGTGPDAKRCFLDARSGRSTRGMATPSTAAYGTWKWKCIRFPKRSSVTFGNSMFSADTSTPAYLYFNIARKTNKSKGGLTVNPWPAENLTPSHWGARKGQWITQTVIRAKDGWYYRFIEADLAPNCLGLEETLTQCSQVRFSAFSNACADCLEVYKDRYLWPEKRAAKYGQYAGHFHWTYKPQRGFTPAEKRKGIILTGHGLRLKEIAELLGNEALFKYNEKTRTADCHTDLVIMGGSSLVIESETLRFHCRAPGGCHFRVKNCAELRIGKSTVTSATEHPFFWMFTSDLNFERYKGHREKQDRGADIVNFAGRLVIRDSVIDKSGWMLLHGARQLVLENTKFQNMVNVDKGSYGTSGGLGNRVKFRKNLGGKYAFQLFNRYALFGSPPFSIKGCAFSGAGEPANINLVGSDHLGKIDIYDTDFSRANLSFKKHPRWFGWSSTWPSEKNCPEAMYFNGTFSLTNCRLPDDLEIQTDRAYVMPKYYLDVKVVDKNGKPVSDALVSVVNEVSPGYPPENIQPVTDCYVDCIDEQLAWPNSGKFNKILDVNDCVRPQDMPEFLMKRTIGEVRDVRKDQKGRIVHFVDRGYRHFIAWKSIKVKETRATFEYDFTYGADGLLAGYTKKRVCYPPTKGWWGWGRKSAYDYTFNYRRDGGEVVGYTVTEKWAGSTERTKYKDVDKVEWYLPLKVKTRRGGHIPAPPDGLHTIALTDYLKTNDGKKEFTYTITVEKDGTKKVITGVDPGPHWYRPSANVPTYTITAVLDGKTVTEADLKKKGLAGPLKKGSK